MMAGAGTDIDAGLPCDEWEAGSLFDLLLKTDLVSDQWPLPAWEETQLTKIPGKTQGKKKQSLTIKPPTGGDPRVGGLVVVDADRRSGCRYQRSRDEEVPRSDDQKETVTPAWWYWPTVSRAWSLTAPS